MRNQTIEPEPLPLRRIRCAIYTRKSTEENLDSEFNSLDAQREAAEAYIASQRHEGWSALAEHYDDGGFSGANTERPALKRLLADIEAGDIDCVVVYKVDRLSRSLLDFAKLMEAFDRKGISFVSVTQQFNTTTPMGRLVLNILLSFAQFEREIISERVRDKVAATRKKGKYIGGMPMLGYDADPVRKCLVVNPQEADLVRHIFARFLETGSATALSQELNAQGNTTKSWVTRKGVRREGNRWDKTDLYRLLQNPVYIGEVSYKGERYPGEHEAIVARRAWEQVQRIFAESPNSRRSRARVRNPALLRRVIRCGACGCAMIPTWTRRRGKQYRYYLCLHATKYGHDTCPTVSLPAGAIEEVVVEQLRALFRAPELLARTYRSARALARAREDELAPTGAEDFNELDVVNALTLFDPVWEQLFPAEQERLVQLLVRQVEVYPDRAEVQIRAEGLASLAAELRGEGRQ